MKAEADRVARGAHRPVPITSAYGLGRILDDHQTPRLRKPVDGLKLNRTSGEVHRDHGPGAGGDRPSHRIGREVARDQVHVRETGLRPGLMKISSALVK